MLMAGILPAETEVLRSYNNQSSIVLLLTTQNCKYFAT